MGSSVLKYRNTPNEDLLEMVFKFGELLGKTKTEIESDLK